MDQNGVHVPPGACVPGDRAEVVVPEHEGTVEWRLDGQITRIEKIAAIDAAIAEPTKVGSVTISFTVIFIFRLVATFFAT